MVRATSRAPAPAKNSSDSASITCHCAGLVSCASSTRMWSRPPSSRQSTQAAVPGRGEQRAGAVDQVVEVEEPGVGLAALEGVDPGAGECG